MKVFLTSLFTFIFTLNLSGQDCNILSKANNILPDKLCSPLSVNWQVSYTGVNNSGTPVQIQYNWDDGTIETITATSTAPGMFQAVLGHTYVSTGDKCNYRPKASMVVNGVVCTSSTQEQIVTVWDDDDHNGGRMHISPEVYPICFGNAANVRFQDLTQFNCVPPNENDIPNLYTRWVQWIYGTDITMTGTPVTINGNAEFFPFTGPVITLPGPVTGSGIYSDILNVANDKLIGQYFEVSLRNWNYCNPYDDPDIPGPPTDPVNGDHAPVITTAIILIVPYPDATITPVDTLCVRGDPVTLKANDNGGNWSGDGVINNKFHPAAAGIGNHSIQYTITNGNGCTDSDQITITVMPGPSVNIEYIGTVYINGPDNELKATPTGGFWSGDGVSNNIFNPESAGLGTHVITYETLPDSFGCSAIDSIHIKVIMPAAPNSYFEPDTVGCTPLSIQFRNMSFNGESYYWDFGDKTYSSEKNPFHIYYIPGEYIVNLIVSNLSGQSSFKKVITVYQSPAAIFNIYPTNVINNTQVVVFSNYSMNSSYYLWKFGDGTTSIEENPWHKYDEPGTYLVTLITTTTEGCVDSMIYKSPIDVDFKTGEIKYPNVFKWNRSGPTGGYWTDNQIDDNVFRPFFTNIIDYQLQIFNRWGVLIYESYDINKGWDGYYSNGKLALQGVYVWKAVGQYADGSYFNKVGDVTFLH